MSGPMQRRIKVESTVKEPKKKRDEWIFFI